MGAKKKKTKVLSVANMKGGCGKDTTTILLATALANENKAVMVLDCDFQRTTLDIFTTEKKMYDDTVMAVKYIHPKEVETWLGKNKHKYDVIFLNIPRMTNEGGETYTIQLLYLCEAVLIPCVGSWVDAFATKAFLEVIEDIKTTQKADKIRFKYWGFMNRFTNRKEAKEVESWLKSAKMPMMENRIKELTIFANPSTYHSILATAEGRRRFGDFYKEFKLKYKV